MTKHSRFFQLPKGHCFIFGPRGTGKSCWLKDHLTDASWIDLLDPVSFRTYLTHPEHLADFTKALPAGTTVVIDEIQRVPELLPMVHKIIESTMGIQFILTGSSARKLKRDGIDLLAGRAVMKRMHPFLASEMGNSFDLQAALDLGMIPLVRSAPEPKLTLKSYIDLYLQEEVKAEGMVRRIDQFSRFLEAISFSHGSLLNLAEVARDCQVKRSTVVGYVDVVEDLLIARLIPVFSKRAKRSLTNHRKFYFFDCGVFRSLRPAGSLDTHQESAGAALEGLVFQHLQAWIDYSAISLQIHYWRTRSGSEVDFILYGNDGFYAIEVKNGKTIHPQDIRSLHSFHEDYPECTPILLYRGQDILKRENILCIPVDLFLKNLIPGKNALDFV